MRTLEEIIYNRLITSSELAEKLTTYRDKPAVFYQTSPDDTQRNWSKNREYPRVNFVIDYQANDDRRTSGVLTVDIWCSGNGAQPEDIEPIIRSLLQDVFMTPEGGYPYAFLWSKSEPFQSSLQSEKNASGIVVGATVTFEIFEFSKQETTDPDPIQALNRYIKGLADDCVVIAEKNLPEIIEPSGNNPVFYFRLERLRRNRETNTVVWLDANIACHIFAAGEEIRWLRALTDDLLLRGEVTMLDSSPMFVTNLSADNSQNALTKGQLNISAQFGLLRLSQKANPIRIFY